MNKRIMRKKIKQFKERIALECYGQLVVITGAQHYLNSGSIKKDFKAVEFYTKIFRKIGTVCSQVVRIAEAGKSYIPEPIDS